MGAPTEAETGKWKTTQRCAGRDAGTLNCDYQNWGQIPINRTTFGKKQKGDFVHREVKHQKAQVTSSTTTQATCGSNARNQLAASLNQQLMTRSAAGVRPQLEPGNFRPLQEEQRTVYKHKKEPAQPGPDTEKKCIQHNLRKCTNRAKK